MSEKLLSGAAARNSPHPWQDWLLSLLLHALLALAAWWLMHSRSTPQVTAIDTPIEWVASDNAAGGGGGGGGGGGQGDGKLGGGGGGGDGTDLLKADGALADATATAQTKESNLSTKGDGDTAAIPPNPKKAASPRRAASTPLTEALVVAKKRELAAKLAAEEGRNKKTGLDAAKTAGIGTGTGSGIGSGSGTGIGSGSGSGIGSSSGSGTGGGTGSGLGSGTGAGIGSGSGGGVGSGTGTGTGSGKGSGVGTGEGSGVGSGVGSGKGAGYGEGTGQDKASWKSILHAYLSSKKRYPNIARRLRQEGVVKLHASFSAQGELLSASVTTSSSVESLDAAALQLVKEAASAAAAKAQPGQAMSFVIPVKYELVD